MEREGGVGIGRGIEKYFTHRQQKSAGSEEDDIDRILMLPVEFSNGCDTC